MKSMTNQKTNTVIYYIQHEKTNSVYVGSTSRWLYNRNANGKKDHGRKTQHKIRLRRNTHTNPHLQKLWNEHDEAEFQFLVYSYHDDNISQRDLWEHEEKLRKKFTNENKTVLNVQGTSNYASAQKGKPNLNIRGHKNPSAKLNEDQVRQIKKRLENGDTQPKIAEDFGVAQSSISQIKRGEIWAWLK
jgi:hypothetical protein